MGKVLVVTKLSVEIVESYKNNIDETQEIIEVWIPGGVFYIDGKKYYQGRSESSYPFLDEGDILIMGLTKNSDNYKNSFDLQTTIAYEFGHLLGLDHTDDYEKYIAILMKHGMGNYTHLTEDDKYGVRSIYGKDDRSLLISASSSKTQYIPNVGHTYYTTGNSDFQTYSKPQLAYQPDQTKGYGHYSMAIREDPNDSNKSIVLLNRITKSGKEGVNNLKFIVYKDGYPYYSWKGENITKYETDYSYIAYPLEDYRLYSRTGYSIVYNPDKEIYKYLWIKE